MSLENSKKKYGENKSVLVPLKQEIPLEIPIAVLNQIKYLCKNIPKVEWSGVLFYTIVGSIKFPSTLQIKLEAILPLDMGTAGYTEYNLDDRFMNFIEEDFEVRALWKVGHIHSHNTMRVFFSGVDDDELYDNSFAHNFYLSLIVNNFMDFTARVGIVAEADRDIKQVPFYALDEEGNKYILDKRNYEVKEKKVFYYECAITSPQEALSVEEAFSTQVAKIMEPKPEKKKEYQYNGKKLEIPSDFRGGKKQHQKKIDDWNPFSQREEDDAELAAWNKSFQPLNVEDFDTLTDYDKQQAAYYDFLCELYNFYELEDYENLEEILDLLAERDLSPSDIAQKASDRYLPTYNDNWPDTSADDFIKTTYDILTLAEDFLQTYPELKLSISVITRMIEKFMTDERSTQSAI